MEGKPQEITREPRRSGGARGERGQRRPYQQPRIERHLTSSLILGNATPNVADGLSGSFRR